MAWLATTFLSLLQVQSQKIMASLIFGQALVNCLLDPKSLKKLAYFLEESFKNVVWQLGLSLKNILCLLCRVGRHEGCNNIDDHFRHIALDDYLHKNIKKGYFCQKFVHVAGHEVQHSNLSQVHIKTEYQHH
jgi:hypothetical protein